MANDMHRGSLTGGSDECGGIYTIAIRDGKQICYYFAAGLRGQSWIDAGFRLCFSPRTA